MKKLAKFPLRIPQLLGLTVAWNILFLIDRLMLGFSPVGPLSLLAVAGLTLIVLSLPYNQLPGRWFVKRREPVFRWRWICWILGLELFILFVGGLYDLTVGF